MAAREKHLYRSREDRIFGGVCGGMAEYFNADPSIVRLLWIIFILLIGWVGLFLYFAAWIIIPIAPKR